MATDDAIPRTPILTNDGIESGRDTLDVWPRPSWPLSLGPQHWTWPSTVTMHTSPSLWLTAAAMCLLENWHILVGLVAEKNEPFEEMNPQQNRSWPDTALPATDADAQENVLPKYNWWKTGNCEIPDIANVNGRSAESSPVAFRNVIGDDGETAQEAMLSRSLLTQRQAWLDEDGPANRFEHTKVRTVPDGMDWRNIKTIEELLKLVMIFDTAGLKSHVEDDVLETKLAVKEMVMLSPAR